MLLSSSCFAARPVWLALAMTSLCGVAGEKLAAAEQQQQQQDVRSTTSSSSSLSRLSYCNMMGEVCYWRGAEDDHHPLASHHAAIATWSPKNPEWVSAVLPSEGVGCGCLKTKNPACSSRRRGGGGGSSFMALMLSAQQEQEQEQEEERRLGRLLQTGKKSSSEGKKSAVPEPTEPPGPAMCDTCCPGGTTQNPAGFPCYPPDTTTLYGQRTFTCLGERRLACLDRNSNTDFTTSFPASCVLPPNRKLAASDNEEQQAKRMTPMEKHLMAVGFVRIPKTGSTTLLYFFTRLVPDLFPWYDYLSEPQDDDDEPIMPRQEGAMVTTKPQMIGAAASSCVYGRVPTTAHLGSNYYHKNNNYNNAAGSSWNSCPHVPYPNLVKQWSRSLEHWVPPKTAVLEDNENDHSFGLRAFSMVRDPFDRLVSFFFYLQSFSDDKTEFLKNTVTEEQYIRVKAGDLYGWMELLHEQGGGCGLELPFQFKYIHQDLDTALSLIQEQEDEEGHVVAPKVFVLLTECYELSLRLLVENFEDQFEGVSVDDFVASPEFESNKNKKSITNKDSYNKLDLDEQGLKSLRELAEVWFEEDFVFYDAAVKQFQNYMAQSKLDPALFGSCAV